MRNVFLLILGLFFGSIQAQDALLLEVFTYDGCSHCMLANRALRNLENDSALKRKIVLLTHHVDYDKHDDFQDSLDHPFSRMRQNELVEKGLCNGIFTPQAVLGGTMCFAISGRKPLIEKVNSFVIDTAEVNVMAAFKRIEEGFSVEFVLDKVDTNWQINLILVENNRIVSPHSGDNVGATLVHTNCLLEAKRFDNRERIKESFRMPEFVLSHPEKYAALVYLQHVQSGEICQVQIFPLTQVR